MYVSAGEVINQDYPVSEALARKELQSHGVPPAVQEEILKTALVCPGQYSSAKILIELGY